MFANFQLQCWMDVGLFVFWCVQALPIFLDDMFNEVVAVILSVTFVLAFGEVCMHACMSWIFPVMQIT
jgi:hypothetical protein